MKEYYIELENMNTDQAVQDYFQLMLDLPDWYGRNLDALHDVLTDICEDTTFVINGPEERAPESAVKMLRVLRDAEKENDHINIEV